MLTLLMAWPATARGQDAGAPTEQSTSGDTATVVVAAPTVIAYLVLAPGVVDSSADLAVVADDWSFAMATLRDSLTRHGVQLALVTESRLRVQVVGERDTVLVLDDEPKVGYMFARPGIGPCRRRGAADPDEVLRAARALVDRRMSSGARTRAMCGARPR